MTRRAVLARLFLDRQELTSNSSVLSLMGRAKLNTVLSSSKLQDASVQRGISVEPFFSLEGLSELVFDNLPHAVFWKHADLTYSGCNQKFAELLGISGTEDIIGRNDKELPWQDTACWRELRRHERMVLARNNSEVYVLETITPVNMQKIWLKVTLAPLRSPDGRIVGLLGLMVDISQEQRAYHVLGTCDTHMRLLLHQLPGTVWTIDPDLSIHLCNGKGFPSALRSNHRSRRRSLYELKPSENGTENIAVCMAKRALNGDSVSFQLVWRRKPYQVKMEPLRASNNHVIGAVGLSIEIPWEQFHFRED